MIQFGNVVITAVRAFTHGDWMTWGGSSKFDHDSFVVGVPWHNGSAPLVIDVEINGHEAQVVSGGESWELYVADMGVWTPCVSDTVSIAANSQAEMLGLLGMLRIDEAILKQFFDWRGELSPEPFYFHPAPEEAQVRRDPPPVAMGNSFTEATPRRITLPEMPAKQVGLTHETSTVVEHRVTISSEQVEEFLKTAVGAPKDAEVMSDFRETCVTWEERK